MKDTPSLRKLWGRRYSFRASCLPSFAPLSSAPLPPPATPLSAGRRTCDKSRSTQEKLRREQPSGAATIALDGMGFCAVDQTEEGRMGAAPAPPGYAAVPGAAGAFLLGAVALNCCARCCPQRPSTTLNTPEGSRTINKIPAKQSLRYNSRNDGL